MAEKIVIEAEVKSNIGDLNNEAKDAAGNFKVMGFSLNGVKKGLASAGKSAKMMFGTMKAGLISSGIGIFVIMIASLFAYFKNTKKGAEMLERAMAGMGAVVSVVTDLFSSMGELIVGAFSNPKEAVIGLWEAIKTNIVNRIDGIIMQFKALGTIIKSAMSFDFDGVTEGAKEFGKATIQMATGMDEVQQKEFADTIKGIAKEMNDEVSAAMRLKGMLQQLKDEEREFSKVRAQTRQDIQKARLDALDETKTAKERLDAVQKANDLELKTTADVLKMQERKIAIQKEQMSLSENMGEDLDELAALEVGLIDLQTASFQTQKRLATEMETLKNEIVAADKARAKEKQDEIDAEFDLMIAQNDEWNKEQQRIRKENLAEEKAAAEESVMIEKAAANAKKSIRAANISNISSGISLVKSLAGENKAIQAGAIIAENAVGIARTIISTQASNAAVIAEGAALAIPSAGASVAAASALVASNNIAAGISIAASAVAAAQGLSALGGGKGGGGAKAPSGGGGGGGGGTPAPQMMSGEFNLSGGVEPEPVKAFVLTDEMSNSQNQLANIRRRATI
tara:strand:- start:7835 stop:9538 length:1704 start_codon:yes stop_codon:yes gene_type:complete